MAKRGRSPGFKMPEEHRGKIRITSLLNLLDQDAMGIIELKDGRRRSIEILLRKALPDLSAVQHTGDVTQFVMRLPEPALTTDAWQDSVKRTDSTKH